MGKWTDDGSCLVTNDEPYFVGTEKRAEQIAGLHNADIDALTAERDELKKRLLDADAYNGMLEATEFALSRVTAERDEARAKLDAIVAMLEPKDSPDDYKKDGAAWHMWHQQAHHHARAVAIAKGEAP